jgi:hypothetical protein
MELRVVEEHVAMLRGVRKCAREHAKKLVLSGRELGL